MKARTASHLAVYDLLLWNPPLSQKRDEGGAPGLYVPGNEGAPCIP